MDTATTLVWIWHWVRSCVMIIQIVMVLGRDKQACHYECLVIREATEWPVLLENV